MSARVSRVLAELWLLVAMLSLPFGLWLFVA